MTGLEKFKLVTGVVVSYGISKIVTGIINSNVPRETRREKVGVFAADVAITAVTQDIIQERVDKKIDDTIELFHKTKKRLKEM